MGVSVVITERWAQAKCDSVAYQRLCSLYERAPAYLGMIKTEGARDTWRQLQSDQRGVGAEQRWRGFLRQSPQSLPIVATASAFEESLKFARDEEIEGLGVRAIAIASIRGDIESSQIALAAACLLHGIESTRMSMGNPQTGELPGIHTMDKAASTRLATQLEAHPELTRWLVVDHEGDLVGRGAPESSDPLDQRLSYFESGEFAAHQTALRSFAAEALRQPPSAVALATSRGLATVGLDEMQRVSDLQQQLTSMAEVRQPALSEHDAMTQQWLTGEDAVKLRVHSASALAAAPDPPLAALHAPTLPQGFAAALDLTPLTPPRDSRKPPG